MTSSSTTPEKDAQDLPGDRPMSINERREMQRIYVRGVELATAAEPQRDGAHLLLGECIRRDPGNLVYAEALLANLSEMTAQRGFAAWVRVKAIRGQLGQAIKQEDWHSATDTSLRILRERPQDLAAIRALARACRGKQQRDAEIRHLQYLLETAQNDLEVLRLCGDSFTRLGQFDRAADCWRQVIQLVDGDTEAIAGLQVVGQDSRHEPDSEEPRITQLEQELQANPGDLAAHTNLVETLVVARQYDRAEEILGQARAACGERLEIGQMFARVQTGRAEFALTIAQNLQAANPGEESDRLVVFQQNQFARVELSVWQERWKQSPGDSSVCLELAVRLKQLGNFREAAQLLQDGFSASDHNPLLLFHLGECLQRMRKFNEALDMFDESIRASQGRSDRPLSSALYRAGVLAISMGQQEKGLKLLGELLKTDPEYPDARSHLDRCG